jgi:uncharacterized protein (TIGR02246 family)
MSARFSVSAFVVACLGLAVSAGAGRAQKPTAAAAARAQIELALARLDSVSRAGDADGNAALFTEDAVVSLGTLDDVRGRDALRSAMVGFYQRNVVQAHQLQLTELEVYGDVAYSRGTYLWVAGARGQPATTERGRYAAVWQRGADGLWRIHRYLENLLPSPSPSPSLR